MNPFTMNGGQVASDLRSGRPGLRASGSDEEQEVSVSNGAVHCTSADAPMNLSGDPLPEENAAYGTESLFETASMKKRTRALWTRSFRSRPES